MTQIRPADVRYYVDADVLGLGHTLARLRSDLTYPGDPGAVIHKRQRPACPVTTPGADDLMWLPEVAVRGWLVITRDGKIQGHRREIAAVREHAVRMVALDTRQARNTWAQLEIVMCRWRQIEQLHDQPGPFIYIATRTTLRPVDLG